MSNKSIYSVVVWIGAVFLVVITLPIALFASLVGDISERLKEDNRHE